MRIICSNSDSIGDFVLREPMYSELASRGHELLLLVRQQTVDLASHLCPGARIVPVPIEPYDLSPVRSTWALKRMRSVLQQFGADRLVVAAYQRTRFDEWLVSSLPRVRTIGFAGRRYPASIDLAQEFATAFSLDVSVDVPAECHDWLKNQRLCEAVIETPVDWRRPAIALTDDQQQSGRNRLASEGVDATNCWIACVGQSARNALRNWTLGHWATVMQHAVETHGWNFVLTGTPDEAAASRQVQQMMGHAAAATVVLHAPDLGFPELVELTASARGYFGRDTGPMHLAAALGKPVVSVLGQAYWPRFIPLADVARLFTISVPCAGCGGVCHYAQPHCIKQVPVEPVLLAIDDLSSAIHLPSAGDSHDVVCEVLPRTAELAESMEREAAARSREQIWLLNHRQQQLTRTQKFDPRYYFERLRAAFNRRNPPGND